METVIILRLIQILITDGVPAFIKLVREFPTDEPTLEEIDAAHSKSTPLKKEDFK